MAHAHHHQSPRCSPPAPAQRPAAPPTCRRATAPPPSHAMIHALRGRPRHIGATPGPSVAGRPGAAPIVHVTRASGLHSGLEWSDVGIGAGLAAALLLSAAGVSGLRRRPATRMPRWTVTMNGAKLKSTMDPCAAGRRARSPACTCGDVLAERRASGLTTTMLAKSSFGEIDINVHLRPPRPCVGVGRRIAPPTSTSSTTDRAGRTTGWHTHPGPSLIEVVAGRRRANPANPDPGSRTPHVYTAGTGFVDPGGDGSHMLRNEGSVQARRSRVQLLRRLPSDGSTRRTPATAALSPRTPRQTYEGGVQPHPQGLDSPSSDTNVPRRRHGRGHDSSSANAAATAIMLAVAATTTMRTDDDGRRPEDTSDQGTRTVLRRPSSRRSRARLPDAFALACAATRDQGWCLLGARRARSSLLQVARDRWCRQHRPARRRGQHPFDRSCRSSATHAVAPCVTEDPGRGESIDDRRRAASAALGDPPGRASRQASPSAAPRALRRAGGGRRPRHPRGPARARGLERSLDVIAHAEPAVDRRGGLLQRALAGLLRRRVRFRRRRRRMTAAAGLVGLYRASMASQAASTARHRRGAADRAAAVGAGPRGLSPRQAVARVVAVLAFHYASTSRARRLGLGLWLGLLPGSAPTALTLLPAPVAAAAIAAIALVGRAPPGSSGGGRPVGGAGRRAPLARRLRAPTAQLADGLRHARGLLRPVREGRRSRRRTLGYLRWRTSRARPACFEAFGTRPELPGLVHGVLRRYAT